MVNDIPSGIILRVSLYLALHLLGRDSAKRFLTSGIFHESVLPQVPKYTIRAISNFVLFGDIRSSRCTTGVIDTGDKWKFLIIFLGHLSVVELTYGYIFSLKFISMCQHYSHCLLPVSTTPVVQVAKFAAGVVDTGCKFAPGVIDAGVVDTGGAPSLMNISRKFSEKFKMTLILGLLGR